MHSTTVRPNVSKRSGKLASPKLRRPPTRSRKSAMASSDAGSHSGSAPRDLLWVLRGEEGTVTVEEYRKRLLEVKSK